MATVLVAVLVGLMAACGSSGGNDQVGTASEADVLALVSGSGAEAAAATSFRYSYDNLDTSEFNQTCEMTLQWEGAIDVSRKLAFLNIRSFDGPTVILSADTMYVKSSALPGWRIPTEWLAVPLTDLQDVNDVDVALGVKLGPKFWADGDAANPRDALAALKDTVTSVAETGREPVRGVDTTRYDLTIDPAKAGVWSGGTTTTSSPASDAASAAALRAARQRWLDQITPEAAPGAPPISDAAKEAFLDGDVGPLADDLEHTTGTSLDSESRTFLEAMAAQDPAQMIESMESSTGTTIDPMAKKLLEGMAKASGDPSSGIGAIFNAFTSITASAWVDHDGALRRLDERVDMGGAQDSTDETVSDHPLVNVSLEFWDIGVPITDDAPDPAATTPVAALSRTTDIPTALSPCYTRIPN